MHTIFADTRVLRKQLWQVYRLAGKFGHERCPFSNIRSKQCQILPSEMDNSNSAYDVTSDLNKKSWLSHPTHEKLIEELQLTPQIISRMMQKIQRKQENAFYVVNLHALEQRFRLWHNFLPFVRPFYAVKCNPDKQLLQTLAQLGCGFDCASHAEIKAVLDQGVHAKDIIYANPCKQPSHIRYSAAQSVDLMTFDSHDELDKIKAVHPNAKLVLRLYVDDTKAICRLGTKFGAMLHDVPSILARAKSLDLNVCGVSFHVGSGCYSVSAYSDAVKRARKAFDIGAAMNLSFSLLDIGGGFPGTETGPITFEDCAKELRASLNEHFPIHSNVSIISEPGRFFAASTHALAVCVIGKKQTPTLDGEHAQSITKNLNNYMYFVNDGLYGSFNCLIYDHPTIQPVFLTNTMARHEKLLPASIWGPTCDGMDCILKDVKMPLLQVGDWICFPSMGAYTCAAASDFNGFAFPEKVYIENDSVAQETEEILYQM